jgi:hypothetical protein
MGQEIYDVASITAGCAISKLSYLIMLVTSNLTISLLPHVPILSEKLQDFQLSVSFDRVFNLELYFGYLAASGRGFGVDACMAE